jgi:hypothetical protein
MIYLGKGARACLFGAVARAISRGLRDAGLERWLSG